MDIPIPYSRYLVNTLKMGPWKCDYNVATWQATSVYQASGFDEDQKAGWS